MRKLLFLFIIFSPCFLYAQKHSLKEFSEYNYEQLNAKLNSQKSILKSLEDKKDSNNIGEALWLMGTIHQAIGNKASDEQIQTAEIIATRKSNLDKAISFFENSNQICEITGDIKHLKANYACLSQIYKSLGQIGDFTSYQKKIIELKNPLKNGKTARLETNRKNFELRQGLAKLNKEKNELLEKKDQQAKIQQENVKRQLSLAEKKRIEDSLRIISTKSALDNQKLITNEKEKKLTVAEERNKFLDSVNKLTLEQSELQSRIKDQEIELNKKSNDLLSKENELQKDTLAHQQKANYFFVGGIVALLLFIFLLLRNFKAQKKFTKDLKAEKKRSEDLLLNILPAEVAEELMQKGFADAKQFDNVSVLFTDFVSFTKVAENMSPKELVGELHVCFKAFDGILTKYHVEKIKTIGDAYMAVAGLPVANRNHALDRVMAARELRDYMVQRQEELGEHTFGIRLGINSGNVVAGIVGLRKFSYDIWGDTVNTAARMEQNSEPGKINISQSTYELIKDEIECTYRGEISAKNKGQMKMYFIE